MLNTITSVTTYVSSCRNDVDSKVTDRRFRDGADCGVSTPVDRLSSWCLEGMDYIVIFITSKTCRHHSLLL